MTTKIIYVANDDTVFYNQADCLKHEERIKNVISKETALKVARDLQDFCNLYADCERCPFFVNRYCGLDSGPSSWNLDQIKLN